jgi:hypothetical protein
MEFNLRKDNNADAFKAVRYCRGHQKASFRKTDSILLLAFWFERTEDNSNYKIDRNLKLGIFFTRARVFLQISNINQFMNL